MLGGDAARLVNTIARVLLIVTIVLYVGALMCMSLVEYYQGDRSVWLYVAAGWVAGNWLYFLPLPGVTYCIRKFLEQQGPVWRWDTIQALLDSAQKQLFEDRVNDELHHHRVTLFKYSKWQFRYRRWPKCGGWLLPKARSGITTKKTTAHFFVPDDADKAEGIAGGAWCSGGLLEQFDLPDITSDPSEQDLREYAKRTRVPYEWLSSRRSKPPRYRAIIAIAVQAAGRRWGVLVIDSRNPSRFEPIKVKSVLNCIEAPLSKLLKRGRYD